MSEELIKRLRRAAQRLDAPRYAYDAALLNEAADALSRPAPVQVPEIVRELIMEVRRHGSLRLASLAIRADSALAAAPSAPAAPAVDAEGASGWRPNMVYGDEPQDEFARVEVRYRNGRIESGAAACFFWNHTGSDDDIMQWRDDDVEANDAFCDYNKVAQFLYGLLDDIDTASDIAKDDDSKYRRLVEHIQARKREAVAECDGYAVTFKTPAIANQEEGK